MLDKLERKDRGFYHFAESWYAPHARPANPDFVDEVNIGFYPPDGGTCGEFCVRFDRLGHGIPPLLHVYNDAFAALAACPDLVAWLADHDGEDFKPSELCTALKALGFRDLTQRREPGMERQERVSHKEAAQLLMESPHFHAVDCGGKLLKKDTEGFYVLPTTNPA